MAYRVVVQADDGIEHFKEVGLASEEWLQQQLLQKVDLFFADLQAALSQNVQIVAGLSELFPPAHQQLLKAKILQYLLELAKLGLILLFRRCFLYSRNSYQSQHQKTSLRFSDLSSCSGKRPEN